LRPAKITVGMPVDYFCEALRLPRLEIAAFQLAPHRLALYIASQVETAAFVAADFFCNP